jgi:hypothetical protein
MKGSYKDNLIKSNWKYNNKMFINETKVLNPTLKTEIIPGKVLNCCPCPGNTPCGAMCGSPLNCGNSLTVPTVYGPPNLSYKNSKYSPQKLDKVNKELQK